MRIYVQRKGSTLGPFSPGELVEQFDAGAIGVQDHAWREGESEWLRMADLLGHAGLTRSGRQVSNKLKPPVGYVEEIAATAPAPLPEEVLFAEVAPEESAVGQVPLLRSSGWREDERGFDWSFVRKIGLATPLLVLLTMLLPWFTFTGIPDLHAMSGFELIGAAKLPVVMLFVVFAVLVLGIAYFSYEARPGDVSPSAGAVVCALVALVALWLLGLWMESVPGAAGVSTGHGMGGGLHLCAAVLMLSIALACVPLRWNPEMSGYLYFAIAVVFLGVFFGIRGTVLAVRYAKSAPQAFSDRLADDRSLGESGKLKSKNIGSMSFFMPDEWQVEMHGPNRFEAVQADRLSAENTFIDHLQWAIYPVIDGGTPNQKVHAGAFDSGENFRSYVTAHLIAPGLEISGQSADEIEVGAVTAVTKGNYSGFDCVVSGLRAEFPNAPPVRYRQRIYLLRYGVLSVTGMLIAEDSHFQHRNLQFQSCIDRSLFEQPGS